jgi:hypothetical protein
MLNVRHLLGQGRDYPWLIHFLDDSKSIRSLKDIEKKSKK